MATQSSTISPRSCMSTAVALLLLSAGAQAEHHAPAHTDHMDHYKPACDKVLRFTELASKPGPDCTDFVSTFNLHELDPEPAVDDYRPIFEVNFYNRLYKTNDIPKHEDFYGFTQGKCHATRMSKDGSMSKASCTQTYTDSTGKSFTATGIYDLSDGTATYAILGGTGEYMGAYGEAHVTYDPSPTIVLGQTPDLYRYEVCLYTPAAKAKY